MALSSDQLLAKFREDMVDDAGRDLWSDDEIYLYIDAAQKEFCRKTLGISDSRTDEVCRLALTDGTEYIGLDPRILKIRGARLQSTGQIVHLSNYESLRTGVPFGWSTDYGQAFTSTYVLNDTPGSPVRCLVTDMEQDMVRVVPISDAEQVVLLSVYRLPLDDITGTNQMLEIHEQHHLYLLYWVKHLALLKQDAETFDKNKSNDMRAAFLAYCDQAKGEQERREHKPRTVQYGGI